MQTLVLGTDVWKNKSAKNKWSIKFKWICKYKQQYNFVNKR